MFDRSIREWNRLMNLSLVGAWVWLLFCSSGSGLAQERITVGPNVQVSRANAERAHYEVYLAADPINPKRLLAGSMISPPGPSQQSYRTITYASFDGGETWQPTLEETAGARTGGDPSCAFTRDGSAYFVALSLEPKTIADQGDVTADSQTRIYRSPDGGKTWGRPTSFPFADRAYVTVDRTKGKYGGQIYINATPIIRSLSDDPNALGFQLATSSDGGATFQRTIRVSLDRHASWGMGNGVVLSDGTYAAIYAAMDESPKPAWDQNRANGVIEFVTSPDGGQSLSVASRLSEWHASFGDARRTTSALPVLAVDESNGPFRDRLYVVWCDIQSGRSQILLSYSQDKGKTWSKPAIVNDDRSRMAGLGPDDFMPTIAVNKDGVVGVAWYDRRENPENLGYNVRFAASWDGGETFGPSVRVSEAPAVFGKRSADAIVALASEAVANRASPVIEATLGYGTFVFNGGHTAGMAASADGGFHPLWVDNRTGISQVWTARVMTRGTAVKNGSTQLADLQDATVKVSLEFFRPIYDLSRKSVTVETYLENTSKDVLTAPLVVRVLSLRSSLGTVAIVNPDNGEIGPGAVWKFDNSLNGGMLRPGERTKGKQIELRLIDAAWPSGINAASMLAHLVQINVRVLAIIRNETEADKTVP